MERGGVNFLFYGVVLAFLVVLHGMHVLLVQPETSYATLFFLLHAVFQGSIEFLVIYAVARFLKYRFHISIYFAFVSFIFILMLMHIVDFVLVRIMGMTFSHTIDMVLDESFENFVEMLQLTGVPLPYWVGLFFFTGVLLPVIGIILYMISGRLFKKRSGELSGQHVNKLLFVLPLVLLTVDIAFLPFISKREYRQFAATLPFKTTLLPYPSEYVSLNKKLSKPTYTAPVVTKPLEKRPNIYIWVVESLREDYVTAESSPHVTQFREENLSLPFTVSGANATQQSWYTIFHGNAALHWSDSRKETVSGSIPLQLLKKMGYALNVYAATNLGYYMMDELLFGKDCSMLSTKEMYPHYPPHVGCESDEQAFSALLRDVSDPDKREGNVFILFLDSTHFEYSWPTSYHPPFPLCETTGSHLQLAESDVELATLKKSYKNAIHFVDHLFNRFRSCLEETGLYDEACIVYTGDHGEEFYEEGRLYHGSHLSSMQTRPPIYYKLGAHGVETIDPDSICISSHADIMPTLLDYVTEGDLDLSFCDGLSLLRLYAERYAIVTRYNGNRAPYEFYIHDGSVKCLLQFDTIKDVYNAKGLHIIHFFDRNEDELHNTNPQRLFDERFSRILSNKFRD